MKKNKSKRLNIDLKKVKMEMYGRFPLYAHYKSIHDLNRSVEFKYNEEEDVYIITDDTSGKLTGEKVDVYDLHDFREKHGLLIGLSVVYDKTEEEMERELKEEVTREIERLMEINAKKEMNK